MAHDFFNDNSDTRPESAKPVSESDMFENEKNDLFAVNDELQSEEIAEKAEEIVENDEQPAQEVEAQDNNIKKLTAMFNEENLDIPADAVFKHKVDGEEVEVTAQELLNNYSGKSSWDKKFSELDKERNDYKQDLNYVNQYISEFAKISKEDPTAGMEYLAKFAGIDPLQYRRQMRDQFVGKYGEYLSMGEDERRVQDLKEENEYYRGQREAEQTRLTERQAQQELQNQFKAVQEANQIEDDRMHQLYGDLQGYMKEQGINKAITPEDIVSLHNAYVSQDRAIAAMNSIDDNLANDGSKINVVESLLRGNPQLSDEDLKNHIAKLWGNDVQKAATNLTKKTIQKKEPIKKQEYKPKTYSNGNVDFF